MKKNIQILAFLVFLISCTNQPAKEAETQYSDNMVTVESDDIAMNQAIAKAKETFIEFDTAYKNGHFDRSDFSVKVRFDVPEGGEHIWAHSITFKNGSFYGIIDEDAVGTDKIKQGDNVKITSKNLSDWMYNHNGVMKGGYTIRILRKKMSQKRKQPFYLNKLD